ncbi:MAG: FAD-binding protein [Coriobacteriia bacterium]|nr:FAD-binding protein [Coriobacteriia bacterium]MBS5477065.1 FAD-binding protein [Coriobacteriia bacterium]
MDTNLSTSRRSFIAGAAAAGVAAATLATAPARASEAAPAAGDPNALPEAWDIETDVVVMGYGYAAQISAISAALEGSKVQVFEKAPEAEAGGNSAVCCGYFNLVSGEGSFDYWKALADGGVSDEECQAVADATELMPQWLKDNVFPDCEISTYEGDKATKTFNGTKYPNAGTMSISIPLTGPGTDKNMGLGNAMWLAIDKVIREEHADAITVNFESPVTHLIFDPATKEVFGVRVQQGDKEICVKAAKGVVMACGGFENNYEMIKDFYLPTHEQFHIGSPYNTGDGIIMLNEIGAKLRHMAAVEYGSACHLELSRKYHQAIPTHNGGDNTHMVYINKHGKRFIAENSRWPAHDKRYPYPCFNQALPTLEVTNYPWWMVFDETRRTKGTIFAWSNPIRNEGWAAVRGTYQWSDDCAPEIEEGLVLKADTLEDLGKQMGFEGDDLQAFLDEMAAFNENGANGEDPVFGREPTNDEADGLGMTVSDAPFYAIQCGICYLNTNGGGDRSVDYQINDWNGNPIPRLFEAGEFGSIFYHYYSGGGNICEAFTSGMKCGQNVSALEAWA